MLNRPDELVFVAMGGLGEIGMNLGAFGYGGTWLMVDLGVAFGDESTPGMEILMANPGFLAEEGTKLSGLLITHAHEDHVGAIPHLWPRLRCPIYATPFAASVIRNKLAEAGLTHVAIREVTANKPFAIGPFEIELIDLTHSIPEPAAVLVKTPAGIALHTGDWKFDPAPVLGKEADYAALERIGSAGVDAILCDSTNALRPGEAGSEQAVRESLIELVGRYSKRVAITCFASNVGRLESAAIAAERNGRSCALVGRSLWRMEQAARDNGYLKDVRPFLREDEVELLPRDQILMICTGSQGEPRSALSRIATADHPNVDLDPDDVVIFSSRVIPGNEKSVGRVQNNLARRGMVVVTDDDELVHVSGHPAQAELTRMYQLVRPRAAVPIHGEARHLLAHAKLADACQVPQTIVATNGDLIRLAPGPAAIIDHTETGRLGLEGKSVVTVADGAFRTRLRMSRSGSAVATIVVDRQGRLLSAPQITVHGLLDPEDEVLDDASDAISKAVETLSPEMARSDEALGDAARYALRRTLAQRSGNKPMTDIHVVRV